MAAPAARISAAQSVFLDLLRFAAALLVFVGHASGDWLTGGYLWQASIGIDVAVTIFFVLSGYVVAATTTARTMPEAYTAARLSRLWSVVLPALVVTFVCDAAGQALAPGFYRDIAPLHTHILDRLNDDGLRRYLLSGLMLQEWHIFDPAQPYPGSNSPFWSLSYELTYYAAFGLILYLRGIWRAVALVALFACAGPAVLLLWPLWLAGAGLWWLRGRLSPAVAATCFAAGLAALAGFALAHPAVASLDGAWTTRFSALLATNLFGGVAVVLLVAGFQTIGHRLDPLAERIARPVRAVADHTFELYLLHIPLVVLAAALVPLPRSPLRALVIYALVVAVVVLVARITPRLRDGLRRALLGLFASRR